MFNEIKDFCKEHKVEIIGFVGLTTAVALLETHTYKKGLKRGQNYVLDRLYRGTNKHGSVEVINGSKIFYAMNKGTYEYARSIEQELNKIKAK